MSVFEVAFEEQYYKEDSLVFVRASLFNFQLLARQEHRFVFLRLSKQLLSLAF